MKNIKKILLTAGSIITVASPIAAVISCGKQQAKHYKILPTYTGQADQLLALGITPDYYPYQLNRTSSFEYLTNPIKYMKIQQDAGNGEFAKAFSDKIKFLYSAIGDKGRSWWNMNAEKNDNSNPNKEYWTTKTGDLTLYEHYLLDDDKKIMETDQAPSYDVALETNFRWSQDPYTRLSKQTINDFLDNSNTTDKIAQKLQIAFGLRNSKGKIANRWKLINGKESPIIDNNNFIQDDPLFNDAWFAYKWHNLFLDNPELKVGGAAENFSKFIIDENAKPIFNADLDIDKKLKTLFQKATLKEEVVNAGLDKLNYSTPTVSVNPHHPIYDAQTEIGEAPMFEGARRDNMLYLFNLASQIQHVTKGEDSFGKPNAEVKQKADQLAKDFKNDPRLEKMKKALDNANKIAGDLDKRLNKIKSYFKDINASGKKLALTTIAPGGGVSTIQTNSKYSFLFDRLGLNYVLPKKQGETEEKTLQDQVDNYESNIADSVYSMDDNGWFWNISGNPKKADEQLANAQTYFSDSSDIQILTVRDKEWKGLSDVAKGNLNVISKKDKRKLEDRRVDYNLWNEGLKTPFVLNMILDKTIDIVEKALGKNKTSSVAKRKEALDWGNYWTQDFVR